MASEQPRTPDDGDPTDHAEASSKRRKLVQADSSAEAEFEGPKESDVPVPPNPSDQPAVKKPRAKYGKKVNEIVIEPAFRLKLVGGKINSFTMDPEDLPPKRTDQKPLYLFKDGVNDDYPPIHDYDAIWFDMARRAYQLGFREVTNHLKNRALRIATMCSGSDAPIHGLKSFQDALKLLPVTYQLKFVHLFSVEIAPHKASFITRNLGVMCFRDVREVAAYPDGGKPTTATGGVADVPGNLDILIAGFACVDYSSLNRNPKNFDDVGESSDTFRAIITYCTLHRPKLVILENVRRAPWQQVLDLIHNETTYSAAMAPVNTKNYYLPQTRNRGYLVMVEQEAAGGKKNANSIVKGWADSLKMFERPASSPVEDFLLRPDDPRVDKAVFDMQPQARASNKAWTLSKGRHQRVRRDLGLGQLRPLTNWIEGGRSTAPDFGSKTWTRAQPHRVLDFLDIAFLRSNHRGYDPLHKPRYWNVAQNVDRENDGSPFGLIGCLTPTASIYISTRAGPMIGAEALGLQGLDVSKIAVTRETEKELIGLAGNAMSTTVVTAVILNLLICAYQSLEAGDGSEDVEREETRHPIIMSYRQLQEPQFLPLETVDSRALLIALPLAPRSLRMCACEGTDRVTNQAIDTCTRCGHTACRTCSGDPQHYYGPSTYANRVRPSLFRDYIRKALPTRLYLQIDLFFIFRKVQAAWIEDSPNRTDWWIFSEALKRGLDGELRYQSIERAHDWTIMYKGDYTRLELKINAEQQMSWYLYLQPRQLSRAHREYMLLKNHIAEMNPTDATNPMSGEWKFRLAPDVSYFWVKITGSGSLVASWLSRQGLERAADEKVWDSLQVQIYDYNQPFLDGYDINGRYELLQECGTSHGSLYKKVAKNSKETPIFLFHDPDYYTLPDQDCFVFATTSHRRKYGEPRDVIAKLEPTWCPNAKPFTDVRCSARRSWKKAFVQLQDVSGLPDREPWDIKTPLVGRPRVSVGSLKLDYVIWPSVSQFCRPNGSPLVECSRYYVAILLCSVPLQRPETDGWEMGDWQTITALLTTKALGWLVEKLKTIPLPPDEWKSIQLPTDLVRCKECTPKEPFIRWERRIKGKRRYIAPYEDPESASKYEDAMKRTVSPFVTQTRIGSPNATGYLRIGLNINVLVHRALAKLTGGYKDRANDLTLCVTWRMDQQYNPTSKPQLITLNSKSNAEDPEVSCDFADGQSLRVDQRKSHHWMLERDARAAPFFEQEIEEACLPEFGYRAVAKVQRKCGCRGGALTDEVGFGKTVMILALIQARKPYDDMHPRSSCEDHVVNFKQHPKLSAHQQAALFHGRIKAHCNKHIALKATLIVVPPTLMRQWEEEIFRFLGQRYVVITIEKEEDLKILTIRDYRMADIVLVSWQVLNSEYYLDRLSAFGGIVEGPPEGGRAFESWLEVAYGACMHQLHALRRSGNLKAHAKALQAELSKHENDPELFRRPASKKLSGQNYLKDAEERRKGSNNGGGVEWPARVRTLPDFGFDKARRPDEIKGVTLDVFCWARCVTDEFPKASPVSISIVANLQAVSRWILSATPPLDTFDDVKRLAYLLGVYLGIDDFSRHSMTAQETKKFRTERSAAEVFRAFNTAATPAWHEERQRQAQFFLDVFTRKNQTSYHYLRWINTLAIVEMAPIELAIQREIEQHIQGQDMKVIKSRWSKANTDRSKRMALVVDGCKEGEEALLHCATRFFHAVDDPEKLDLEIMHNTVISNREADLIHGFRRVFLYFLIAETLRARVVDFPLNKPEIYAELTLSIKSDAFGDRDVMRVIRSLRGWAEENCRDFPLTCLYDAIGKDIPRLWTDRRRIPELRSIAGVLRGHIEDSIVGWRASRYFQNARDLQQALYHLPLARKLRFPSPIKLQVPSQVPDLSTALADQPGSSGGSAVFGNEKRARGELQFSTAQFNKTFPHGYYILSSSGVEKWCAWNAVIESLKAQHPGLIELLQAQYPEEKDKIEWPTAARLDLILTKTGNRLSQEGNSLPANLVDMFSQDLNYTVKQVEAALTIWGQQYNINLRIGVKVRSAFVMLQALYFDIRLTLRNVGGKQRPSSRAIHTKSGKIPDSLGVQQRPKSR